jgi:hypothetical protein
MNDEKQDKWAIGDAVSRCCRFGRYASNQGSATITCDVDGTYNSEL